MVTEPVVPLYRVLEGLCVEGMVIGWREIAQGLSFLHSKVSAATCTLPTPSFEALRQAGYEVSLQAHP